MTRSHGSPTHDGEHIDWTEALDALELEGEVTAPWVREAIAWLDGLLPTDVRQVIDAGSGPGAAAVLLAQAFPTAQVLALDGNDVLLERARQRAEAAGVGDRFSIRHGQIGPRMGEAGSADLVWASHVVHHLDDITAGLTALGELIRPDGLLAVAEGGLPWRFLPGGYGVGDPGLLSRLDAASSDHAGHRWGMNSEAVSGTRDWPLRIADAGLEHVASRSFLLDLPAPLDDRTRSFVARRFELEPDVVGRLSREDAAALTRLVDKDDPAALVNRPDLFVLTAQTVHVARRP